MDYISDNRPPRQPQTKPMAVGAAFDAYVKSYIADNIFGGLRGFAWEELFEAQVEEHNRDWAREAGDFVFSEYRKSGAMADLMLELGKATYEPKLESIIEEPVKINGEDIVLHGRPDLWFVTGGDNHIILDWKVNGYCAKRTVSPRPGYVKVRGSFGNVGPHKDAHLMLVNDIMINIASRLEDIDEKWALQTCIYSWLMGEEVGGKFICGIDQCVFKPGPKMRVASYRSYISPEYQQKVADMVSEVWAACCSGNICEDQEALDACQDVWFLIRR